MRDECYWSGLDLVAKESVCTNRAELGDKMEFNDDQMTLAMCI